MLKTNQQTGEFKIAATQHAFDVLTNKLYSDPVAAVVRELLTNAVEVSPPGRPPKVTAPTRTNPVLVIEDEGPGIPEDVVESAVTTLFGSTKDAGDEDSVGYFGLGLKSPLGVLDQFIIQTGNRVYTLFRSHPDTGVPGYTAVDSARHVKGTRIVLPIPEHLIDQFIRAVDKWSRLVPIQDPVLLVETGRPGCLFVVGDPESELAQHLRGGDNRPPLAQIVRLPNGFTVLHPMRQYPNGWQTWPSTVLALAATKDVAPATPSRETLVEGNPLESLTPEDFAKQAPYNNAIVRMYAERIHRRFVPRFGSGVALTPVGKKGWKTSHPGNLDMATKGDAIVVMGTPQPVIEELNRCSPNRRIAIVRKLLEHLGASPDLRMTIVLIPENTCDVVPNRFRLDRTSEQLRLEIAGYLLHAYPEHYPTGFKYNSALLVQGLDLPHLEQVTPDAIMWHEYGDFKLPPKRKASDSFSTKRMTAGGPDLPDVATLQAARVVVVLHPQYQHLWTLKQLSDVYHHWQALCQTLPGLEVLVTKDGTNHWSATRKRLIEAKVDREAIWATFPNTGPHDPPGVHELRSRRGSYISWKLLRDVIPYEFLPGRFIHPHTAWTWLRRLEALEQVVTPPSWRVWDSFKMALRTLAERPVDPLAERLGLYPDRDPLRESESALPQVVSRDPASNPQRDTAALIESAAALYPARAMISGWYVHDLLARREMARLLRQLRANQR